MKLEHKDQIHIRNVRCVTELSTIVVLFMDWIQNDSFDIAYEILEILEVIRSWLSQP